MTEAKPTQAFPIINKETVRQAFRDADDAASAAAINWINEALNQDRTLSPCMMLDLCGNAYLSFPDRRAKVFKLAKELGIAHSHGSVNINYRFKERQEHGLHVAAIKAAYEVLTNQYGYTVIRRDYID